MTWPGESRPSVVERNIAARRHLAAICLVEMLKLRNPEYTPGPQMYDAVEGLVDRIVDALERW